MANPLYDFLILVALAGSIYVILLVIAMVYLLSNEETLR